MNLKLVAAISVLVATPAFAQAQQDAPKPTVADAQKVVQIISGDKAKAKVYCDFGKLNYQIAAAQDNKDQKRVEELSKQADAMVQKLGPEYDRLMNGLQKLDPSSKEGKVFVAALLPLEKCVPINSATLTAPAVHWRSSRQRCRPRCDRRI